MPFYLELAGLLDSMKILRSYYRGGVQGSGLWGILGLGFRGVLSFLFQLQGCFLGLWGSGTLGIQRVGFDKGAEGQNFRTFISPPTPQGFFFYGYEYPKTLNPLNPKALFYLLRRCISLRGGAVGCRLQLGSSAVIRRSDGMGFKALAIDHKAFPG